MPEKMTSIGTAWAVTTLACTDLKAEKSFFTDRLGLQAMDMVDAPQYAVVTAGHGTWISLYERPTAVHCDATAMAFVVDDIAKTVDELRGRGVTFEEYDMDWLRTVNGIATNPDGSKAAWFKDPAGNILSLTEFSPAQKEMGQKMMG